MEIFIIFVMSIVVFQILDLLHQNYKDKENNRKNGNIRNNNNSKK